MRVKVDPSSVRETIKSAKTGGYIELLSGLVPNKSALVVLRKTIPVPFDPSAGSRRAPETSGRRESDRGGGTRGVLRFGVRLWK